MAIKPFRWLLAAAAVIRRKSRKQKQARQQQEPVRPAPIEKSVQLRCGIVLNNRIVKAAMSEALTDQHNNLSDAYINLHGLWGESGAALLLIGHTAMDREHLEHAGNFVLDEKTDLEPVQKLTAAAKQHGAKILCQLAHSGRQTPQTLNPHPISISDVRLDLPGYGKPRAADEKNIADTIQNFARSAVLAEQAGFDGVEIHAAHGYLLSSSLSPKINTRNDQWGGSLENRARLLLSVVGAVRAAVDKTFIVAVKLNSSDFQKGGFSHQDSVAVAKMLEQQNIDFLEISGGNFEAPVAYESIAKSTGQTREAYFLDYARDITAALDIPVMVTGGFRSAAVMNKAIADGAADLIGMARPFIIDPLFPKKLLRGEIDSAPTTERDFPPADQLPKGAVLNWFCHQVTVAAKHGAADLTVSVVDGHNLYLENIKSATADRMAAAG